MRSRTRVALCLGLVVAFGLVGIGQTAAQDDSGVTIRLEPANGTIPEDDAATYDVVATGLDDGLGSYNVTVTSSDGQVAYVSTEEYVVTGGSSRASYRNFDRAARQIAVGDVDTSVDGEATLAHVVVRGAEPGTVDLGIDAPRLTTSDGSEYAIAATGDAEVEVEMDRPGAEFTLGMIDTFDPYRSTTGTDQLTYWTVEAYDVDDGVRNLTYAVTPSDPSVATVENVTAPGSSASLNVTRSPDGTSTVEAVDLNVTGEGVAALGTVAVRTRAAGETRLRLQIANATNRTGATYRVTGTRGGRLDVVPWSTGASVELRPSDGQPAQGVAYNVVARNLTEGLSAFEVHLADLGQSTPDVEELPTREGHHGGMGIKPREGEIWFEVDDIDGVNGSTVVLGRVTLDDASSVDALDPHVRPIVVLDTAGQAYRVGYEPLGAGEEPGESTGSDAGGGAGGSNGGTGDLSPVVTVLGLFLGALAAGLAARRR